MEKDKITIQELELAAVHSGISLASTMGIKQLWIESDSLLAVNTIKGYYPCPRRRKRTLAGIRRNLSKLSDWKVTHIWREANRAADFLSKIDCPIKGNCIAGSPIPPLLADIEKEDLEGTLYFRL
ncbi:uncharacterized protein LOC143869960 [Tasmannia lanceolata]|uniref:uncharacterized protein LOC143869960 n=1 Tax=Tasmannia lanceolata TaxID=3420 RepID=UPI00406344E1